MQIRKHTHRQTHTHAFTERVGESERETATTVYPRCDCNSTAARLLCDACKSRGARIAVASQPRCKTVNCSVVVKTFLGLEIKTENLAIRSRDRDRDRDLDKMKSSVLESRDHGLEITTLVNCNHITHVSLMVLDRKISKVTRST